jgi:hypothetical protein
MAASSISPWSVWNATTCRRRLSSFRYLRSSSRGTGLERTARAYGRPVSCQTPVNGIGVESAVDDEEPGLQFGDPGSHPFRNDPGKAFG